MIDSLRLSVATRNVFLESVHEEAPSTDRARMAMKNDRDASAFTNGWEALGDHSNIFTWVSE